MTYANHTRTRPAQARHRPPVITPPTQPLAGQVLNSTKVGFTWQISHWDRLVRFLILGAEGGTYYAGERELTRDNAQAVLLCISEDGPRVVATLVEISQAGRAPKNDEAMFVLALCLSSGDRATLNAAKAAVPQVVRTGGHMLTFVPTVEAFRGWGRAFRTSVQRWYNDRPVEQLAYQLVKYQQRGGWSERDVLRLAKPVPHSPGHAAAYQWATRGWPDIGEGEPVDGTKFLWVYERAKRATTETEIIGLINDYRLTWEFVPGQWLGSTAVWKALLPNLPLAALVRNLGRMTANGTLKPLGREVDTVLAALGNQAHILASRLHPMSLLVATKTYASGQGQRGNLAWTPIQPIVTALDKAFSLAFGNVTPTGERLMLALDVSGSMRSPVYGGRARNHTPVKTGRHRGPVAALREKPGLPITCREASAAMALITAAVEPRHVFVGFSAGGTNFQGTGKSTFSFGQPDGISELAIGPHQRMDDVIDYIDRLGFGATDPSLPMQYAQARGLAVDTFIVYTDNEVNCGRMHASQALQQYRAATGIPAKLIVVAMTATDFTIADPNDPGMLDMCGFDLTTPAAIAAFIGRNEPSEIQPDPVEEDEA